MPDPNSFGLSAIGQIAVNAHDLERAVVFYRDLWMAFFRDSGKQFFGAHEPGCTLKVSDSRYSTPTPWAQKDEHENPYHPILPGLTGKETNSHPCGA